MPSQSALRLPGSLTKTQGLVCSIAAVGFAFDIYELLMLPLVVRPALQELGGFQPGTSDFSMWFSLLFYLPALAGGLFGLLGGYLTDRLGRKRVLTWSIFLYAFSSFASGYSTSLPMLLFLRCLVFVGVSVEFVAAVAWLAELFPEHRQREGVLGFTQAFSSLGGFMVALANGIAASWSMNETAPLFLGLELPALQLPAICLPPLMDFLGSIGNQHAHWRYTLMSGILPAMPLLVIRPFLPESPLWLKKRKVGLLKRPRLTELFEPRLRRTTVLVTLMYTLSFASAFGAIQQIAQIVPGLPEIKVAVASVLAEKLPQEKRESLKANWMKEGKSAEEIAKSFASVERRIAGLIEQSYSSHATKVQEIGGLLGRIVLAYLALFITCRQRLFRVFLLPGIFIMPLAFGWAGVNSFSTMEYGVFLAGFLTIAQFSFWGNYLPHAFPLHLRGTGESFAANVGGRMIGTCFAAITQWIAYMLPLEAPYSDRIAYTAGGVALTCYLLNYIISFQLPEPEERDLSA